ncbi:MAG: hypothetical protein H7836_01550 [Magnetococcus sp. YQC-3]
MTARKIINVKVFTATTKYIKGDFKMDSVDEVLYYVMCSLKSGDFDKDDLIIKLSCCDDMRRYGAYEDILYHWVDLVKKEQYDEVKNDLINIFDSRE